MPPPLVPPPREGFTLSGPSVVLDPKTHAIRPDLADIRMAKQVFAPHYAAPQVCHVVDVVPLRESRDVTSETLATLARGDVFEVLEVAGSLAWGVAPSSGFVGYVAAEALVPAS